MKRRFGFVSNSSSTSFCLAGLFIEDEEIKDKIESLSLGDLESYSDGSYNYYLGLPISLMKDDETKSDFIERSKQMIKKLLPDLDVNGVRFLIDGWYNG